MKHFILGGVVSAGLALSLSACSEIEGVDYLRLGHPADPTSKAGKLEGMSRALVPENITPVPDLKAAKAATPSSGTKTMDQGSTPGGSMSGHRGSH